MTDYLSSATSAADAVSCVRSGMRVFLHGAAATPTPLIEALCALGAPPDHTRERPS